MKDPAKKLIVIANKMFNFDHSKGLCSTCTPTDVDRLNVVRLKRAFSRWGYGFTTNGHGGPFGHAIWFDAGDTSTLDAQLRGRLN